jgi:glutathione S-transferase
MKLIGMLDSPYVRRVAITLQLLGLHFEHQSLSVFRTFDEFERINSVVKAPTLVCDDGTVLMDSTLIIQYAEALARPRTLMPTDLPALQRDLRLIGLALAGCDKAVQIIYEREQRPVEKLHQPWMTRVTRQLMAAFRELERELARKPFVATSEHMSQAGLTIAVVWHFTQQTIANVVPATDFPNLAAFSARAEAMEEFKAAPHSASTYSPPRQ